MYVVFDHLHMKNNCNDNTGENFSSWNSKFTENLSSFLQLLGRTKIVTKGI